MYLSRKMPGLIILALPINKNGDCGQYQKILQNLSSESRLITIISGYPLESRYGIPLPIP